MIQFIICSKDRASQLDLTLSSMKTYFKEWKSQTFDILYTYSNEAYKKGYDKVMALHPEFNWIKESNYRTDIINIFNNGKESLVSFLVDDDVFIDDITLESPEFKLFLENPKIACLSGRMAPYIDFCYTANIPTNPPKFNPDGTWDWTDSSLKGDWNYPCSIASFHVFHKEDLAPAINDGNYRAPNTFEAALASAPPIHRPLMICFNRAKCYCGTNNRVQTENMNRNENTHPIDSLNVMFTMGRRLSPTKNYGLMSNTAHGPVKYSWE
jgi:hypothetical protein